MGEVSVDNLENISKRNAKEGIVPSTIPHELGYLYMMSVFIISKWYTGSAISVQSHKRSALFVDVLLK